ncbi:MAG: threonine-phosphate decarboxylase CobD [Pseudomonadota bacterium]
MIPTDLRHGGASDAMRAAYPNAPTPWIDLSTGINPWPYSDLTVSQDALARLPTQALSAACAMAMAHSIGAPPNAVVLAPGSESLIRLLPTVIAPRRVAILSPTYGDHKEVWTETGAEITLTDDPLAHAASADAVVVTHPNNPDGRVFDREALDHARQTLAAKGGWLIVDEAYGELGPDQSIAAQGGADGLIVLRSFGKFFGLAGIRLGAALAPEPLRDLLRTRLGAWPVSGPALEIGCRAYADLDWQAQTRERLKGAAGRLDQILDTAGLTPVGGTDLFRYVEVAAAYAAFERLAQAGIYVRRFEHSQSYLRIGLPATEAQEVRLAAALSLSV